MISTLSGGPKSKSGPLYSNRQFTLLQVTKDRLLSAIYEDQNFIEIELLKNIEEGNERVSRLEYHSKGGGGAGQSNGASKCVARLSREGPKCSPFHLLYESRLKRLIFPVHLGESLVSFTPYS